MPLHFVPGDLVVLKNLDDKSLNGKEAVLVEREQRRKLWVVRLDSGREIHVKHANLESKTSSPKGKRPKVEQPDAKTEDSDSEGEEEDSNMFGFPKPLVSKPPVAKRGEHASVKLNPYDGSDALVDSTALPAHGRVQRPDTWLRAHKKAKLHEILKVNFSSVRELVGMMQADRGFRVVHTKSIRAEDMDALIVGAVQIAFSAFHDKNKDGDDEEFGFEGYYTKTPTVTWKGNDELTNIELIFYYKGEKVCASFIDYGRETYMSLYLLSER